MDVLPEQQIVLKPQSNRPSVNNEYDMQRLSISELIQRNESPHKMGPIMLRQPSTPPRYSMPTNEKIQSLVRIVAPAAVDSVDAATVSKHIKSNAKQQHQQPRVKEDFFDETLLAKLNFKNARLTERDGTMMHHSLLYNESVTLPMAREEDPMFSTARHRVKRTILTAEQEQRKKRRKRVATRPESANKNQQQPHATMEESLSHTAPANVIRTNDDKTFKLPHISKPENEKTSSGSPPADTEDSIVDKIIAATTKHVKLPKSRIPKEFYIVDSAPIALGEHNTTSSEFDPESGTWQTRIFPSKQPAGRMEVVHLAKTFEAMLNQFSDQMYVHVACEHICSKSNPNAYTKSELYMLDIIGSEIARQVSRNEKYHKVGHVPLQ